MQKIPVKIGNLEEVFCAYLTSIPEQELDCYDFNVPLSWLPQEVVDRCKRWMYAEPTEGLISIIVPWGWGLSHADVAMATTVDRDDILPEQCYCKVSISEEDIQALIDLVEKTGGFSK